MLVGLSIGLLYVFPPSRFAGLLASSLTSLGSPSSPPGASTPAQLETARESAQDLEIVLAHSEGDASWVTRVAVPVAVCNKAGSVPLPETVLPKPFCSPNETYGREASAYLSYIVNRYDMLPTRVAFVHDYRFANVQHPAGSLQHAIETARPELPYVPLVNRWFLMSDSREDLPKGSPNTTNPQIAANAWFTAISDWHAHMQPFTGTEMPHYVRVANGAEFVVRGDSIKRWPKELYENLLEYTLKVPPRANPNDHAAAVVLEIVWSILFAGSNDICANLKNCTYDDAINAMFDLDATFVKVWK